MATLIDGANSYLIVQIDPDEAEQVMADLEAMRRELAARAGWSTSANEPKIGCIAASGLRDRPLRYRVRQNLVQGLHPGMAASGIVMLAAAAGTAGTVVATLLNGPVIGSLNVCIPNGETRRFTVMPAANGALDITYELSLVSPVVIPNPATAAVGAEGRGVLLAG